ncbi:RNA polymerase sigma-70 factor [Brevibacillus reuszeri]|uniref:RNA polymerase sigma-70 factor n=1 Tax=Brevibacillus reuszeri TaxID=54915 RepID=UPI0028966955|nr:RNA polymerase sigma-70 factor [Brevibacillus reuszeri]
MPIRMEDVYQEYKALLFSLAYRMLGSVTEAEDIVQETFLAFAQNDFNDIHHVKSYLCKAVTNRCLDTLKSARWKREQYVGQWLPEPYMADRSEHDPLHVVMEKEAVSYGLLVLLDTLTPQERAVYILRTALDYDYRAIAEMLDKTEDSCRKLFSRAGQKLKGAGLQTETQPERSTRLVTQLIQAISQADAKTLISLLTNDAVLVSDGGGKARSALRPIFSDQRIVAFLLGIWPRWAASSTMQVRTMNGQDGIVVMSDGELKITFQFVLHPVEDRIERIYMMVNPEKLSHLVANA